MKKFYVLILFFIILAAAVISCSKGNLPSSNGLPYNLASVTPSFTPTLTNTTTNTCTFTPTTTGTLTFTSTATNTATVTSTNTPGIVNVQPIVSFNGNNEFNANWQLYNSNNTLITTQTIGTVYTAQISPSQYGTWTVTLPTQSGYGWQTTFQTINITGAGSYNPSFTYSGASISNPGSVSYSSGVPWSQAENITYNYSGNMVVPIILVGSGFDGSNFSLSPNNVSLSNGGTANLTFSKNNCTVESTSLNFTANDNAGNSEANNSNGVSKGYTVSPSFSLNGGSGNQFLTVSVNDNGLGCGASYSVNVSGNYIGPGGVPDTFNNSGTVSNGNSWNTQNLYGVEIVTGHITISLPNSTSSGSIAFTIINDQNSSPQSGNPVWSPSY